MASVTNTQCRVAVLNGGYPAWVAAGYETEKTAYSTLEASSAAEAAAHPTSSPSYSATLQVEGCQCLFFGPDTVLQTCQDAKTSCLLQMQPQLVREISDMLRNVETGKEAVVDARVADRFKGRAPEPRAGMRGGHIPNSLNVPFLSLLQDGRYAIHVGSLFMNLPGGFELKVVSRADSKRLRRSEPHLGAQAWIGICPL